MGVVVNTNISSITASRILSENRADLEKAMERLASGKRINSAADDAAGMAVSAKMRADIRSLNQSVRNVNDAISLVNTYDGAASEIESILIRMREAVIDEMFVLTTTPMTFSSLNEGGLCRPHIVPVITSPTL